MRIGPTFPAELAAAGIPLDGVIWDAAAGAIVACPPSLHDRIVAVLAAHEAAVAPPPVVTGNQWAFALGDLGLATSWRAAVTRCKDKDQIRVGLIARDTPLSVTDPLLCRVAARAGSDAAGAPIIDVPTVFAKALTEPT